MMPASQIRIFAVLGAVALAAWATASAQTPAPPAPPAAPAVKNLVGNGGFETAFKRPNLWDGVDSGGYLSGERGALSVLTTSGAIADSAMPLSVSLADMSNDGLLDIVTMDVLGYLRIFFNKGTPQEPKFETGDLADIFLSRIPPNDPVMEATNREDLRRGPRLNATTMFKTGKRDLIIGNYVGEVLALPNSGSVQVPAFRQPQDVGRIAIPTSKDPKRKWGNLFAPATWDWNADGREDLLLGEGSYSANNIHLLLNSGGGITPKFEEEKRHILAFGDGLEQISPAVVDYNGDGKPDILMTERSGKIAVYLNKGEPWRGDGPPPEVPFSSFLNSKGGTALSFGGISTVAAGDLTGDGLFDLVVGRSNGRIAFVKNSGTKTEPKWEAPVDLKGTPGTPDMNIPSGWEVDYGLERGNFLAYVTVVKDTEDPKLAPAEGKACVKVAYAPSHNTVMAAPTWYPPALGNFKPADLKPNTGLGSAPARFFKFSQSGRARLVPGQSYTLSMKVRGRISDGLFGVNYSGSKKIEGRTERGDRGAVTQKGGGEAREDIDEVVPFSAGPAWTEIKKDFRVAFKSPDLKDLKDAQAQIAIIFQVPQGGELYIDDVKLIQKQ